VGLIHALGGLGRGLGDEGFQPVGEGIDRLAQIHDTLGQVAAEVIGVGGEGAEGGEQTEDEGSLVHKNRNNIRRMGLAP
jgi:hypothetical protein